MKTLIQTLTLSAILVTLTNPSFAEDFSKKHPRRTEVNKRVRNQEKRINAGVKTGEITADEAKTDRQNLRNIKKEERAEVKVNGGHLTQDQTKNLNQELNVNSQKIQEEKKQ